MSYKTGSWGEQAKARSKKRKEYFKKRQAKKNPPSWETTNSAGLGRYGENIGKGLLRGSSLVLQTGYDLIWNNKKIEVKTAKPCRGKGRKSKKWNFTVRNKEQRKCDYFLIICLNASLKVLYIYLIPSEKIMSNNITIGKFSKAKYQAYLVKQERS